MEAYSLDIKTPAITNTHSHFSTAYTERSGRQVKEHLRQKMAKMRELGDDFKRSDLLKTPKGTRDFGPEQMAIREKVISIIVEAFKRHGAVTIDTPVFELKEILTGNYGEEGSKLIYDLADQGGEKCSLRYDLTVPFARYLAENKILNFKRYQIAKVYRRDQPVMTKGRYREFYQCDFDIAGPGELMIQESECLKVVTEILTAMDIGEFEIRVNHRSLLKGIFSDCGIPSDSFKTVCSSIDKLDKQPWCEIRKELIDDKGIESEAVDKLNWFMELKEKNPNWSDSDLLDNITKRPSGTDQSNGDIIKAVDELRLLVEYSQLFNFSKNMIIFPSLARGLDYYTGVIYEVIMKEFSFPNSNANLQQLKDENMDNSLQEPSVTLGSVAAGGRYDDLVGIFSKFGKGKKSDVPCVGVSFGIERLFTIMEMKSKAHSNLNIRVSPTDVYVATVKPADKSRMLKERIGICVQLWDAGIRAEMSYKSNPKLLDQIQFCERNSIPWMVLFGDEELKNNCVKLRDIVAKEDKDVPIQKLVATIKEKLALKN